MNCTPRRPAAAALVALTVLFAHAALAGAAGEGSGRPYASDKKIGIDEKLGAFVPLDLTFADEEGKPVRLGDLVDGPTVLTLVYFRCPGICSPLLHELASTVDRCKLVPGVDYKLVTVSFDKDETPELARTARTNLLAEMTRRVPPESWRFLTGEAGSIMRLADGVGFRFRKEKQDFLHAGTVIFLSPKGKIVRYLGGLKLFPADLELAVLDAAQGRPRTLMQRIQRLCYAFDPKGKTYIFKVNRIILAVTLLGVGAFLVFLLVSRVRRKPVAGSPGGHPAPHRVP